MRSEDYQLLLLAASTITLQLMRLVLVMVKQRRINSCRINVVDLMLSSSRAMQMIGAYTAAAV